MYTLLMICPITHILFVFMINKNYIQSNLLKSDYAEEVVCMCFFLLHRYVWISSIKTTLNHVLFPCSPKLNDFSLICYIFIRLYFLWSIDCSFTSLFFVLFFLVWVFHGVLVKKLKICTYACHGRQFNNCHIYC